MKPEFDLETRLLQATSRQRAAGDDETAALRDAFLAFGKGLEQATSNQDVERLLTNLRATTAAAPADVNVAARAKSGQFVVWLMALAAVALVGLGVASYLMNQNGSVAPQITQQKTTPEQRVLPDEPATPEATSPPQIAASEPAAPAEQDDDAFGWDDTLEETFTSMQQRVRSAGTLAGASDMRLETLNERIQSAAEELDPTSL